MSEAPLRIAIIGAGLIGSRHAALVARHQCCALAAIIDPSPAAAGLAEQHGCAWMADTAGLSRVIADAVIVATPNALHAPIGLVCAALGLPCLVEKPIADDLEAAKALVSAFRQAGLPLLVGHHRRYHPFVAAAQALLASGEIGTPVCVSIVWAVRKPDSYFAAGPWRLGADGGPLMINLIHEIDLLRCIFGDIDEIAALSSSRQRGMPVEDSAAICMRFASGMLATATLSDAALTPWSFEGATGENPNIATTGIASWRVGCTAGAFDFPVLRVWRDAAGGTGDWSRPLADDRPGTAGVEPLFEQLDHFVRLVRGIDSQPRVSGQDGVEALRVIRAIQHAARSGTMVDLGSGRDFLS